jgi:cardiolipin synthase
MLIVDGKVAFTGGMNLGDDYAGRADGGHGWNDVQARIEGPVVLDLHVLFELSWRASVPWTFEATHEHFAQPERTAIAGAPTRAQALAVGRFGKRRFIQHHLQHAIRAARERIWIEAAYFIPNRVLRGALKRAARRGVDVRVLLPRNADVPGLAAASRATWTSLLNAGVRIYEWLPGMLHAKTFVVDGTWLMVGSYNLDARSLLYNLEVTLAVLDARAAEQLEEKFRDDLDQSERVDPAEWRRRGLWQRLRERFFYLFRSRF